jgi:glycosyltransferase 2 family protein
VIARLLASWWVRAGITAVILAYLLRQIDGGAALRAMLAADPAALLLVALLVLADRVVMIWRWLLLLRATGTAITTAEAARIFLVSSFVGSFLPAGVGGDAARAYALGRRTSQRGAAVASVAADRILGVMAIALMGAVGVWLYSRTHGDEDIQRLAAAVAGLVGLGTLAAGWADRWLRLLPERLWHVAPVRLALRVADGLAVYRSTPGTLLAVFGLSALVQMLRILQAYGLGQAIGIDVPFSYYLVFMPIGLLMLLIPVSVSGFGLPQGVIVWLLRPLGVPDALSLALSNVIILSGLFGNLPGAWVYLRGARSPQPVARGL